MDVGSILKLKQMREQVKAELKYIPRGDLDQNICRQAYSALRLHGLGRKSGGNVPKEKALVDAIKVVKRMNPDFCPIFDRSKFDENLLRQYSAGDRSVLACICGTGNRSMKLKK
jgi:hypothetical protein